MVRTVGHLPGAADGRFESVAVRGAAPVGSRPSVVDIGPQYYLRPTITIYNLRDKYKGNVAWHTTVTVAYIQAMPNIRPTQRKAENKLTHLL